MVAGNQDFRSWVTTALAKHTAGQVALQGILLWLHIIPASDNRKQGSETPMSSGYKIYPSCPSYRTGH